MARFAAKVNSEEPVQLKENLPVAGPVAGRPGDLNGPTAVFTTMPTTPSMGTLGSVATKKVFPAS